MPDRPSLSSRVTLPISWDRLDQTPSLDVREAIAWSNDTTIAFLLHGIEAEASLRSADEKLTEALAPLRAKLDIVIDMLGRLSYRDIQLPPRREIEFSLARMAWSAPLPLPLGNWLRIRLFLHPTYLEPVVLYGEVIGCSVTEQDTGYRVEVDLLELPEATGDAVIRLAYLAQRRELGQRLAPLALARWDR
jgi:hypothetical protein